MKAGIRRKWTDLGATVLYGEYTQYIDQIGPAALNAGVTSSEFTRWGLGVAQEIDKAAMSVWLKYRQHGGELTGGPFAGDLDAFRYISAGWADLFLKAWARPQSVRLRSARGPSSMGAYSKRNIAKAAIQAMPAASIMIM